MGVKQSELLTNKLKICENCEWCLYHGEYATEERAKEVLEEITNAYVCMELINTNQLNIQKGELKGSDLAKLICYKMPKE